MSEKLIDGKILVASKTEKFSEMDITFVIANDKRENIGNRDFRRKLRKFIVEKFIGLVGSSSVMISGTEDSFFVSIYFEDESLENKIIEVIKCDAELQSIIIRW